MAPQNDNCRIWTIVHQPCSTYPTFSKVSQHSAIPRTRYIGQSMQDYFARWEQMSAPLVTIVAPIGKVLLVTMFVERFVDRLESQLGTALSMPPTRDDPKGQLVTSRSLQDFILLQGSRLIGETSQNKALVAQPSRADKNKGLKKSSWNGVECGYCGRKDHVKAECFEREQGKSKDDGKKNDNEGQALITATNTKKQQT